MKNILLVTIDSLRADHVGYHGYDRETTPIIDEYASQGSRFTNAFAHRGGTKVSFPAILTSVTPLMFGGHDNVSAQQTLVSEVFAEHGYRTGGFHSNLYLSAQFGYDRGWDTFYDSAPDKSSTARLRRWMKTNLQGTPILPVLKRAYDMLESSTGVNVGSYHVPGDEITDLAVQFLQNGGDTDRPTFLWVHYMDVHHPYLPPSEYQLEFRDETVRERDSIKLRRKFIEEPENVTAEELQTFIDLYDAEVRFNDDQVGRLLDAVEQQWGEDYVMVLTADHGDHFLERGYFRGGAEYDVKTHVPLFVSGWNDEGEYDELVGLADIPPTLVDIAGFDIPDNYFGYSLRDLVFDGVWNREAVIGGRRVDGNEFYSVREHEWKLIERAKESDELYHLSDDPAEKDNVLGEFPVHERRLRDKIDHHRQLVRSTEDESVERPEMSDEVKERLRRLGYKE